MKANMLKLNADKTHILNAGTRQRLQNLVSLVKVSIDGFLLEEEFELDKHELLLGCLISPDLKWKSHITTLKSKLKKRLVALTNLRFTAPFNTKKLVADGIFNSIMVYCLPLFGGCDGVHIKELQILQNKAAQVVCNVPPRFSRKLLFSKTNWLTVNQLSVYHALITTFRIRQSKEPEYLAEILTNDGRQQRIHRTITKLSLAMKSFTFRASSLWNNLPSNLRNSSSQAYFKKHLRTWVQQNVKQFLDEHLG